MFHRRPPISLAESSLQWSSRIPGDNFVRGNHPQTQKSEARAKKIREYLDMKRQEPSQRRWGARTETTNKTKDLETDKKQLSTLPVFDIPKQMNVERVPEPSQEASVRDEMEIKSQKVQKWEQDLEKRKKVMKTVMEQLEKHPACRISAMDHKKLIEWCRDPNSNKFVLGYIQMVEVMCTNRKKQLLRQSSMTLEDLKIMVRINEDLSEMVLLKHYLEPIADLLDVY